MRHQLVGAGVLIAVSVGYKVAIAAGGTLEQAHLAYLQSNPLAFLDDFALGMLLAALSVHVEVTGRTPRPLRLLDRRPELAWLIGGAALLSSARESA